MQPDDDFFKHLGTLNNGTTLQQTYKAYKNSPNNYCFQLNGALRSGFALNQYMQCLNDVNDIIRAKNNSALTLYRMTPHHEFTPSGAEVALNIPFKYPAFLSVTRDINVLQRFCPAYGIPTILKISCPIDTAMALMEEGTHVVNEAEILLQSGTEYKIVKSSKITDQSIIQTYVGAHNASKHNFIYELELDVTNNSPYSNSVCQKHFFKF